MLTSLFGDLNPPKSAERRPESEEPDTGFAATAILETVDTQVNTRGQMVDRHLHELVVSGSPAKAIREHFAATRADLERASRLIALHDPSGIWAGQVVKALSDAGGQPIERLHLREQGTLRTLATIERTTLERHFDDTLKVYHAEVRAPGPENAEIPVALMERSHMTAVIVGPMQPYAIDAMLSALWDASQLPSWRCPALLFLLPPGAVWIANKIGGVAWPPRLRVQVLSEPLNSASAVWNALLGIWNHVKTLPAWDPPMGEPLPEDHDFPIKIADLGPRPAPAPAASPPTAPAAAEADAEVALAERPAPAAVIERTRDVRGARAPLDAARAGRALNVLLSTEGLLGCAVVDVGTGLTLAREQREDLPVDLELAAAACTQVLRAHRLAARSMGLEDHVEEIIVGSGTRQQILRTVARRPDLFVFVLLDRPRSTLALARYKLAEAEKLLG